MTTRAEGSASSLQFLQLVGVVAPSLLIVTVLIMFGGLFGWALVMELRSAGDKGGIVLLVLALYLGLATWLGSAFLRFGVRLLPLASSGRRRPALIGLLVVALAAPLMLFVLLASELGDKVPFLSSRTPLRPGGEFDFEAMGESLELFFLIFGAWLSISLGAPLAILLNRHLKPTAWRGGPYLLFLRRFRGLSNAIGIGPLIRGTPAGTRVVFLVGPRHNPRIWNPFMMAFSGINMTRPFSSTPICLQSTERSWRHDIEAFANDARAIVVDLTDDSKSMEFERRVAEKVDHPDAVLWLHDRTADVTELPGVGCHVPYRTSNWGAVPATLIAFVLAGYLTLAVVVSLPIPPLSSEAGDASRLAYGAALIGIPVASGIAFARTYAWHPRLTRLSKRRIRLAVRRALEPE